VRGCSFGTPQTSVYLKEGLQHAIVAENNGVKGVKVVNEIGGKAIVVNNEPAE